MMVTYPSTYNLRKAKGQEVTIAYGKRHLLLFRLATTNKKSIFVIDSIAGVNSVRIKGFTDLSRTDTLISPAPQ